MEKNATAAPPADRASAPEEVLPLQGVRIVDFGWVYAAPIATRSLADMGAEVIKVENRKHLDELRTSPSNVSRDIEKDPVFHDINRNKLSLAVDFAKPEGAALIKRLVAVSDVVVENYSPGVLAKRGLDYPDLVAVRPDLIMLAMSAAGQTGPLHEIRTYGPSISALSGLDSMVGYPGERVLGSQGFYPDMVGAIHGVISVLAALWHRDNTGRGQYIDLSQWEATVGMLGDAILDYTMNGFVRGTQGNRNPAASPHGNYPCQGDDAWVAIAVEGESAWRGFCRALGEPAWTGEPWAADGHRRVANAETVDRHVAEWTRERTPEEATAALQAEGVAAGPSLHVGERYFHPHFSERGFHVDLEHPATGVDIVGGIPWKLHGTPGQIRRPAPLYGEHTDYVLSDLLELSEAEQAKLREEEVIG
jgi:benzylsuccinate CoA-transferase BbsF subunit